MLWFIVVLLTILKVWFYTPVYSLIIFISVIWMILMVLMINKMSKMLMNLMGLIIISFFLSSSLWKFFIFYEMSILPMAIMIMGWGNNPSRFTSTFYMFMYTLIFSLPCLFLMVFNWKMLMSINLNISNNFMNILSMYLFFSLFLVKIPTYFLHYWLPKAHVEASTLGSIILAGGLLKMGSLGFLKILKWLKCLLNNNYFIMSSFLALILCLNQSDFKKLVALMSVSHMSMSLGSLNTFFNTGLTGFMLMNIIHTLVSSMMFYYSGLMSSLSKTRLMYLSFMTSFKFITMIFILIILSNLGVPPFYSMFLEFISFSIIFYTNFLTFMLLFMMILMVLTLNLFILNFFKIENFQSFKSLNYFMLLIILFLMILLWIFNIY